MLFCLCVGGASRFSPSTCALPAAYSIYRRFGEDQHDLLSSLLRQQTFDLTLPRTKLDFVAQWALAAMEDLLHRARMEFDAAETGVKYILLQLGDECRCDSSASFEFQWDHDERESVHNAIEWCRSVRSFEARDDLLPIFSVLRPEHGTVWATTAMISPNNSNAPRDFASRHGVSVGRSSRGRETEQVLRQNVWSGC